MRCSKNSQAREENLKQFFFFVSLQFWRFDLKESEKHENPSIHQMINVAYINECHR